MGRPEVITIGAQGRLVVPAAVRQRLGLSPGDELVVVDDDERLVLEPRRAAAARVHGMLAHLATEVSPVDELIAERREEARRDDEEEQARGA